MKTKLSVLLIITTIWVMVLNSSFGLIPPIGKLINPFYGFWKNEVSKEIPKNYEANLKGLHKPVSIKLDDQRVPHISAQNEHDLFFMQGYLTAKDRLWTMELSTRIASGRLSEWIGEMTLDIDKYRRRMGLAHHAEKTVKMMEKSADKQTINMLLAYSAGVNAYINSLSEKDFPLEYKLLNARPEAWSPIKSILITREMTAMLAGKSEDLHMTKILNLFGRENTEKLFPNHSLVEVPAVKSENNQFLTFKPKLPNQPEDVFISEQITQIEPPKQKGLGSNNWVISGKNTLSGNPILANDPHLSFSMPSIWYQVQLTLGDRNVYGVSIPGVPNIVIGFNENIAWGMTNVDADVVDWYKIYFAKDKKDSYIFDGKAVSFEKIVEKILIKGGREVIDTVLYTHHGPIIYQKNEKNNNDKIPSGYAFKWVGNQATDEIKSFYLLNQAKNYDDFSKALSFFGSPAQNFVFASKTNDIALWVAGKFPLKWMQQGKFLLDGSKKSHEWQSFIPFEQLPHIKNPENGYLLSANQNPTDRKYPYYLNWEFASADRAKRIDECLNKMKKATIESCRALQLDNFNTRAADYLPVLLAKIDIKKLSSSQKQALEVLQNWDLQNNADAIAPSIFKEWQMRLMENIWSDEFRKVGETPLRFPTSEITLQLMRNEPNSVWFDKKSTPNKETLDEIITYSYKSAVDSLFKYIGKIDEKWQWHRYKSTDMYHPIPGAFAFSSIDLKTGGGEDIVNATGQSFGPTWRMVVEMGNPVKAYGILPTGQSGNPGSYYYDNMLKDWSEGKLKELVFITKNHSMNQKIVSNQTYKP